MDDDILLDRRGLGEMGIRFSSAHVWKMCRDGKFPKPCQPNGVGSRLFWRLGDIRRWRDGQWTPRKLAASPSAGVTPASRRRKLPLVVAEPPPQRAPRRKFEVVSAPRRPLPPSTASVAPRRRPRGTFGTGENEWFTPREYVAAARDVMGGIDLDPASNVIAQQTVQATEFFTKQDDGLTRDWHGRVWLNPPYAQPFVAQFVSKLVQSVGSGAVEQAIALCHNYTSSRWFHQAAGAAAAICFTRGRIAFLDPSGRKACPTQGQAFFYFGDAVAGFREVFGRFGFVTVGGSNAWRRFPERPPQAPRRRPLPLPTTTIVAPRRRLP